MGLINQLITGGPHIVGMASWVRKSLKHPWREDGEATWRRKLGGFQQFSATSNFCLNHTRPGNLLHSELERSTMFSGKINYFDWAMFNSYV